MIKQDSIHEDHFVKKYEETDTKRKLNYENVIEASDQNEDMFDLTRNILDDTNNAILNVDISRLKPPEISQNKLYSSESPLQEKNDNHEIKEEIHEDATPKMLISMHRKQTPSSYYKDSDNSECTDNNHNDEQSQTNIDQSVDPNSNYDPTEIKYDDIIKDEETLKFLDYYFQDIPTQIHIDDFWASLIEYYKEILDQYPIPLDNLKKSIFEKFEKSDGNVSFNKLQARTSEIGLDRYIEFLIKEIHEANRNEEVQEIYLQFDEIRTELEDERNVINKQRENLEDWEDELNERQQNIENMYYESKSDLENEATRLYKEAEIKVKKMFKEQTKKMQTIERNLQNKITVIKNKISKNNSLNNTTMRSANMSNILKSSKGADDPLTASKRNNEKLKARVANLEKSYEVMKTKCKSAEEQLEKERADRNKYQEDYYKAKSRKEIVIKENKDLNEKVISLQSQLQEAQEKIQLLENDTSKYNVKIRNNSPESVLKTQDLEDSQDLDAILNIVPEHKTIEESMSKPKETSKTRKAQKKLKNSSKIKPVTEIVYAKGSTEEANLYIELNTIVLDALN